MHIGRDSEGDFELAAEMIGRLPNLSREEAEKLMEGAHGICPYSHATRGNMDVKLSMES